MKARRASGVKRFQDIPNVGPAMERDFRVLGITTPAALKTKDAYRLYQKMCRVSGHRQDPCVLDTYLAVIDFMNGAPPYPWWHYTSERKRQYPHL